MDPDFSYCLDTLKSSNTSFYFALKLISKEKYRATVALYAFCRKVDDIVDESKSTSDSHKKLDLWIKHIDDMYDCKANHPITRILQQYIDIYKLPKQCFYDIIYGMRQDLLITKYDNLEDLYQYCYYVASAVGLLLVRIFGNNKKEVLDYAYNIGIALQLINIIRDVKEDADRGRIYLPLSLLEKHNINYQDVLKYNVSNLKIESLLLELATNAYNFRKKGLSMLTAKDKIQQLPGIIMANIYFALLKKIQTANFDVFHNKIRLKPMEKIFVIIKTFLGALK